MWSKAAGGFNVTYNCIEDEGMELLTGSVDSNTFSSGTTSHSLPVLPSLFASSSSCASKR